MVFSLWIIGNLTVRTAFQWSGTSFWWHVLSSLAVVVKETFIPNIICVVQGPYVQDRLRLFKYPKSQMTISDRIYYCADQVFFV